MDDALYDTCFFNLHKVTNSKISKKQPFKPFNFECHLFFNPTQGAEQQMFKNQTAKLIQKWHLFFALIL